MASSVVLPTTTTTLNSQENQQECRIQTQNLPPQQISYSNNNLSHNGNNNGIVNPKKRSFDEINVADDNSPCFKIRLLVNQLRPLILQAISSPILETCEARRGIQEKLELIVDQYRQQALSLTKSNGEVRDFASEKQSEQRLSLLLRSHQLTQEKRISAGKSIVKQTHENHQIPGSYIVGGSAFGWNFLMFQGTKPEYYGRTKEAFRAGE